MKSKLKVDRSNKIKGSTSDLRFSEDEVFCYRAAAVLLFNSKNEVLLRIRPEDSEYYPNKFDFSVASRCLESESITKCARRAFKKEFNLEFKSIDFVAFFEPSKDRKNIFHYLFKIEIDENQYFEDERYVWMDKKEIIGRINIDQNLFTPALKSSLFSFFGISNILIIDDNPIPTIKTIKVLVEKFSDGQSDLVFENSQSLFEWDELLKNKVSEDYNNFYGRYFTFLVPNNKTITIFFYNPRLSIFENNSLLIEKLFKRKHFTHIWLDYGHSPIKLIGQTKSIVVENEEEEGQLSKSTEQLDDKRILEYFAKTEQIAFYSYNPTLSQYKVNNIKKGVWEKLQSENNLNIKKESIYFIETSETLKIYDFESRLAAIEETIHHNGKAETFLGTIDAYNAYGELLANILYDLHGFRDNRLIKKEIGRYNFFNETNNRFLKKIKAINSSYKILQSDISNSNNFKLGLISFQYYDDKKEYFLLDTPYKEYYEDYDNEIKINETLSPIFNGKLLKVDKFLWIKFIYHISSNDDFEVFVDYSNPRLQDASKEFLKYLHTAIFYDPIFFKKLKQNDNRKNGVNILFKNDPKEILSKERVEVIYYINEIEILNNKGVLHYGIFRKIEKKSYEYVTEQEISKDDIEEINYNFGKPIIFPLVEETVFPKLGQEIKKHSLLNALSTVLNRNGSHNLGSHVLAILSSEDLVKKFLDKDRTYDTSHNEKDSDVIYKPFYYKHLNWSGESNKKQEREELVAYFNAYLKNRLDLLAAVGTSGEAVMLNNKPLFKGVFKNFERNLVLLEHISGKGTDFKYKFCLTVNDKTCIDKDIDIEVAMPNDLLGDQAFYLLLENIIRNTAKHGSYESDERVLFTINVNTTESNDDFYAIEIWDNNCLQERVGIENETIQEEEHKKSRITIIAETNDRIDKDILQDDFNIREGGWGTIEMKIACCYLSGLPLRNIDNDAYRTDTVNNKLPIIEAFDKEVKVDEITKNHLAYRFYIQKPKSVLVIDLDNQLKEAERQAKSLTEKGITILITDELETAFTKRTIYKHQFMVAFAKAETDVSFELKKWFDNKQLPNKVLKINDRKFISEDLSNTCYDLMFCQRIKLNINNPSNNDILLKKDDDFINISNLKYKSVYQKTGISPRIQQFKNHGWIEGLNYFEPYGSTSSLGLLFGNFNAKEERKKITQYHIIGSLVEAANSSILVIDERIQASQRLYYKPEKGDKVSLSKVYEESKIVIPNARLNLNKAQEQNDNIVKYIQKEINEKPYDFLILHFGIMEKVVQKSGYENSKKGFKEFLGELRNLSLNNNFKIILTSGRGTPSDLPDDEYFCNFSSISYYLTDNYGRSKAHLINLLKNLRAK